MYPADVDILCCPSCFGKLLIAEKVQEDQGEIIAGRLRCEACDDVYPIEEGIVNFISSAEYNKSWDYKWTVLDAGEGLNYAVTLPEDPQFNPENIYDLSSYDGQAFLSAKNGIALDVGCGVGQNAYRLLRENFPKKLVALDLTQAPRIFREVMLKRFPEFREKILFVRASVFKMPFRDATFDYVMSLGVLHHTGDTRNAIRQSCRVLKPGGEVNIWVYASELMPIDINEPGHDYVSFWTKLRILLRYERIQIWVRLFRSISEEATMKWLKFFSSEFWWQWTLIPVFGWIPRIIFPTFRHAEQRQRLLNNFDGFRNNWAETWGEHELFPVFKECGIVIKGISSWRLGMWGIKKPEIYTNLR